MIKVMIVDDSPLVRKIATDILNSDPKISVVATAASAEFALEKLKRIHPDVITMDIEMPGMGGLAAIKQIMMRQPVPIIVLSAHAQKGAELTIQALEDGAVDFVLKPTGSLSGGIDHIAQSLIEKVKGAGEVKVKEGEREKIRGVQETEQYYKRNEKEKKYQGTYGHYKIVAIGTSTGGPVALKKVLFPLPENFPAGIVVVQHMPPLFTNAFAQRLNTQCGLAVKEAEDGDLILPGRVLIAPGDYHMTVTPYDKKSRVLLHKWAPISGHRPSVDALMHSVAREYGSRAVGIIMTGMGKDGAVGIKELRKTKGRVLAQDEESSVIFGMNGEVVKNGDADEVVSVDTIACRLMEHIPIYQSV